MQQQPGGNLPGQQQQGAFPPPSVNPQQQAAYSAQQSVGGYQAQSSQAQPVNAQQISLYKQLLQSTIQEKQLQFFYPSSDPRLDQAATVAATHMDEVSARWRLPREVCQDLAKLALFDIILYIDNSASMQLEEDGGRINDLRQVLFHVVEIVRLFDADGFSLRFMNGPSGESALENIKDVRTVEEYLNRPGLFHGVTPLGTELQEQILKDLVTKAQRLCLPKPVLVITITDGIPVGEAKSTLHDVILRATRSVAQTKCGSGTISFQFAQVGNDRKAQDFLTELDNDPQVGHLVDCTSNYEQESEQMRKARPPVNLTAQLWLLKMLVGAIDSSYDSKDEIGSHSSGQAGGGPPPQYSTHPQHGTQAAYGQSQSIQQPSYQPYNQQAHGQPLSQPYGQQAYGQPPPQPYSQQAYGQPPPQPYYGQPGYGQPQPDQKGYNAPYSQ